MKKKLAYSPEIISASSQSLVPLRNKFKHNDIKEVPGWRNPNGLNKNEIKITSCKPYKVKHKKDYYSPVNYALEDRFPYILPSKLLEKSSPRKQTFGKITSLHQLNQEKSLKNENKPKKVSISLMVDEGENSVDLEENRMTALFSHRSLENLKKLEKQKNSKFTEQKSKKTQQKSGKYASATRLGFPLTPNILNDRNYELMTQNEIDEQLIMRSTTKSVSPLKLPAILNTPVNEDIQNSPNIETIQNSKLVQCDPTVPNKNLLAKGKKIDLQKEEKNRSKREKKSKNNSSEDESFDIPKYGGLNEWKKIEKKNFKSSEKNSQDLNEEIKEIQRIMDENEIRSDNKLEMRILKKKFIEDERPHENFSPEKLFTEKINVNVNQIQNTNKEDNEIKKIIPIGSSEINILGVPESAESNNMSFTNSNAISSKISSEFDPEDSKNSSFHDTNEPKKRKKKRKNYEKSQNEDMNLDESRLSKNITKNKTLSENRSNPNSRSESDKREKLKKNSTKTRQNENPRRSTRMNKEINIFHGDILTSELNTQQLSPSDPAKLRKKGVKFTLPPTFANSDLQKESNQDLSLIEEKTNPSSHADFNSPTPEKQNITKIQSLRSQKKLSIRITDASGITKRPTISHSTPNLKEKPRKSIINTTPSRKSNLKNPRKSLKNVEDSNEPNPVDHLNCEPILKIEEINESQISEIQGPNDHSEFSHNETLTNKSSALPSSSISKLTVNRKSKLNLPAEEISRNSSRKSSRMYDTKNTLEFGKSKSSSKSNLLKVHNQQSIKKNIYSDVSENNFEGSSENSDLGYTSSDISKYSITKQIELDQKYLKSEVKDHKKNIEDSHGMKYLHLYLEDDLAKRIKYNDPVKNFVVNFSYSILRSFNNMMHQINLNSKLNAGKVKRKNQKINRDDSIFNDIARGKLKLNKKKSEKIKVDIKKVSKTPKPAEITHSKDSPTYYSREIALKKGIFKSPSPNKSITPLEKLEKNSKNEKSNFSESSSEFYSEDSNDLYETLMESPSRNILLYELNRASLSAQIAKQLIIQQSELRNLEFGNDSDDIGTDKSSESVPNKDLEEEIKYMASHIHISPQQFFFTAPFSFNLPQKGKNLFNFNELENGKHEIDYENLEKYVQKTQFINLHNIEKKINGNLSPIVIADEEQFTEDQKYLMRMKKIKHKRKREENILKNLQALSQDEIKKNDKKNNIVNGTAKKGKAADTVTDVKYEGDTFEEKVYLRMKNSPNRIAKATFQVNYLNPDIF